MKINIYRKGRKIIGLSEGQIIRDIGLLPPSDFRRTLRTDEASEETSHRIEMLESLLCVCVFSYE